MRIHKFERVLVLVMCQVIVPCGASEGTIICGKASKWESNGTAFCYALGFTVQTAGDLTGEPCYGSKSSLEPVVESVIKTETFAWFQDLQKLVREMTLVQQISWVVTLFLIGTTVFNRFCISLFLFPSHPSVSF